MVIWTRIMCEQKKNNWSIDQIKVLKNENKEKTFDHILSINNLINHWLSFFFVFFWLQLPYTIYIIIIYTSDLTICWITHSIIIFVCENIGHGHILLIFHLIIMFFVVVVVIYCKTKKFKIIDQQSIWFVSQTIILYAHIIIISSFLFYILFFPMI